VAAGCSSQSARFGGSGLDEIFTASTNQRNIMAPKSQPFPADTAMSAGGSPSGTVTRGSLPPAGTAQARPAAEPAVTTAMAAPSPESRMATATSDPAGWSRAGGTQVDIKPGETVYNLSRRFGVPANVIMSANGLTESEGLKAGQTIVIPTYVYSRQAPVSAPDSNPRTAMAKSSRGENLPSDGSPQTTSRTAALSAPKAVSPRPAVSSAGGSAATGANGYKVQEGDTLTQIAKRHGVSTVALKQANGLDDGLIRIGQTLKIPSGGTAAVASAAPAQTEPEVTGTTASREPAKVEVAAYTPPKKTERLIEQAEEDAPDSTGIGRMRWPVRGRIISGFGSGSGKANDGIDIAVPEGTAIKAAENGVVIYAGDGLKDFGNTVLVRHENGLVTVYGHASELKVARGDTVKRGQEIAVSGMTGSTEAPKLHFEVRKNSAPVDPATYLE
jgi:murein DD-endopeptidase MepM/ murein hydrolase activator NlpD